MQAGLSGVRGDMRSGRCLCLRCSTMAGKAMMRTRRFLHAEMATALHGPALHVQLPRCQGGIADGSRRAGNSLGEGLRAIERLQRSKERLRVQRRPLWLRQRRQQLALLLAQHLRRRAGSCPDSFVDGSSRAFFLKEFIVCVHAFARITAQRTLQQLGHQVGTKSNACALQEG